MTMTLSFHESIAPDGSPDYRDHVQSDRAMYGSEAPFKDDFHLLRDKLEIPGIDKFIERPRINALLERSVEQFPSTLISGRAGTGKTAMAARFAASKNTVAWYTVESTDIEWATFSRYFLAAVSLSDEVAHDTGNHTDDGQEVDQSTIARFLLRAFSRKYVAQERMPSLIVLDDIHHIFDAIWFEDFFNLLLYSLPAETHLLLLCRSKPPSPLWRLRSKQMLNVLDERVITFNLDETKDLFDSLGLSISCAYEANLTCFGRISKLLQYVVSLQSVRQTLVECPIRSDSG